METFDDSLSKQDYRLKLEAAIKELEATIKERDYWKKESEKFKTLYEIWKEY